MFDVKHLHNLLQNKVIAIASYAGTYFYLLSSQFVYKRLPKNCNVIKYHPDMKNLVENFNPYRKKIWLNHKGTSIYIF